MKARIKELIAPALIASFLRVGVMTAAFISTGTSVMTQGDTQSYLIPGRNLILHGAFTNNGVSEIDRTPGYPLFATLAGMLFNHVLLVVVAQIAISIASMWLIWRIARRVFQDRQVGVIAAWIYAVEPLSILYTARIMPETLFVFLLLAMIDRLLAFQRTLKPIDIAVAGIFLAAATYVRPASYYLVIPLAAGLAVMSRKLRGYRWKAPALLVLIVAPLLMLWQVRNFVETGYSGFSSIVEKNLYFFQSAEITAELEHLSLAGEQKKLGYPGDLDYVNAHPEQKLWGQAQRLQYMRTEALRVLAAHRGLYLRSHLVGVALVAFTPCAIEWLQILGVNPDNSKDQPIPHRIVNEGIVASIRQIALHHATVLVFMMALEGGLIALYLLAIVGMAGSDLFQAECLLLIGVALYFLLVSGGAQAVGRYRMPVMPELCVFAAAGISYACKRKAGPTDVVMSRLAE